MNRPQRPPTFPVALAYAALVLLFFAPHLLGLAAFPDGDFNQHFLPFSLFQQDALLGLRLPVWDQYTNSGHPFLADAQSAVFYPVSNALLFLTGFDRSAAGRLYWLQVEAALHLFLACLFTYMLARRLTGRRMAGFVAGAVFGFSGYLTGYPPVQLGVLRAAVWLPAILLLLLPNDDAATSQENEGDGKNERSARPVRVPLRRFFPQWKRWLAAAAVHAVAFFAGHPQTFLFLSYAAGGWMLMLRAVDLGRQRRTSGGKMAGARFFFGQALLFVAQVTAYIGILVLLTLAQLWPAFEFTQLSVRSSLTFEQLSGGFSLHDTWQLLLPGILTQYAPQYVSIAALGLALIAVSALFSTGLSLPAGAPYARPAALFFVICGAVALLLSYGANGPLYGLFHRFAPGGYLFRGQERAIYLVAFSLSVLSGYGLALLPTVTARQRRNLCWGFVVAVTVGAALFLLLWQLPARVEATRAQFLFLSAKAVLFAAAFAILGGPRFASGMTAPDEPVSRVRLILLIPLLLVDLFIANFTTNLANGPAIRGALARPEATATLQEAQAAADETDSLPPRVYNEFRLPESSGQFVGWEDVYGASPLRLAKYDTLFQNFPLERMWELTGTGVVLTWRRELFVESQSMAEFPQPADTTFLHRVAQPSPRLWWTQTARSVSDKTALALLADPAFDPKAEALVAAADAAKLGNDWSDGRMTFGNGGAAALQVERKGPAHLLIQIESAQPGLLFISENWMPGWRATWNGQSRLPVVRAHQAFLGVPVPAGPGTLELAYRPDSVNWGLVVSAAAWALLLLALRHQLAAAARHAWRSARNAATELSRPPVQPPAMPASQTSRIPDPVEDKRAGLNNIHTSTQRANGDEEDLRETSPPSWLDLISNRQRQRAAILAAILTGFALRIFRLDFQELRGDETFGYFFSLQPFHAIVEQTLALSEPHPVGSYFLQHLWYPVAGASEFALRAMAALAGTAAIPLTFRLARQLRLGAAVALTGSLLMAVSAYAIWHSQDARMYTLSLALTSAATVLALHLIERPASWPALAAYAVCAAAAIHVHYFAVFVLLALNLYVLTAALTAVIRRQFFLSGPGEAQNAKPKNAVWFRWALAQIAAAALTAPWLIAAWQTLARYHGNGDSPEFGAMLWRSLGVFALGETVPHHIWRFDAGLLAAAVIGAGILSGIHGAGGAAGQGAAAGPARKPPARRPERPPAPFDPHRPSLLLLLYLFVPLFATWVSARERPIFNERYLIAALPPFLLLLAIGAARIGGRVEEWLGWRWRCWVTGAEVVESDESLPAHSRTEQLTSAGRRAPSPSRPSLLTRIPVGQLAAAVLILVTIAANLYSLRNYYFDPAFSKTRGWRELAATLDRWSAGLTVDEARVAQNFPDPTLWYYYAGDIEHIVLPPGPHDAEGATKAVEALRDSGVERVILPVQPAPNWDSAGIAQDALGRAYRLTAQQSVGVWPLQLYARPDPQRWLLSDVAFVNGIRLKRFQVGPQTAPEGGVLVIHIDWSGDPATLTGGEKIFLHLLDEAGSLVAQTDPGLRMDSTEESFSYGLLLPPALPTGSLRLIAGLYDITLEGAPRILTNGGTDSVLLARFGDLQ